MTQEEKELLLKDLCARLPYRVRINRERIVGSYVSIDFNLSLGTFDKLKVGIQDNELLIRPYLRSFSSMTEEERKEYYTLEHACYKQTDWLNAHHFDYRGLIPMGLAFEAPKDMYKTK